MLLDQPRLHGVEIVELKNIRDLSLDFNASALTGIMGSNRSGKTTVLHALACAFAPVAGGGEYKFPMFFKPNSDALWKDSNFSIVYGGRVGSETHRNLRQEYRKDADRWSPRYANRPSRYVKLIGIADSVPDVESIALNSMIHYTKSPRKALVDTEVLKCAGGVLNEDYSDYFGVVYSYRARNSIAVSARGVTYSGLSMSSGEQRVFRILEAVFAAPKYGLVLVDEIDLFLHQDALDRLFRVLAEHCEKTSKQLIFTTHFPPVGRMYENVDIHFIHKTASKTLSWRGYSHEALRHITGTQSRPVSVYVEDDVGERIVSGVAQQLSIRKYVSIGRFGSAANAAAVVAGIHASNPKDESYLAVLDGDVCAGPESRRARLKAVWTGDTPKHIADRRWLAKRIRTFAPSFVGGSKSLRMCPEQALHKMVTDLPAEAVPSNLAPIHEIACTITNVLNRHHFVDQIVDVTGDNRDVVVAAVVDLARLSAGWGRYTRVLRRWLSNQKHKLGL
jgi:ABC-type lipoprotein export system ATPase subunit